MQSTCWWTRGSGLARALVLSLALVAGGAWAQAPAVTILGMRMGAPVYLPHCAGGSQQPTKGMCITERMQAKGKAYSGEAKVLIACCEQPDWMMGVTLFAEVVDGHLERVMIPTKGVRHQAAAIADLERKFGAPVSRSNKPMQNGYGARYEAIDAGWVNATARVDFAGGVDGQEYGTLVVETPKGRDALQMRRLKTTATRRSL